MTLSKEPGEKIRNIQDNDQAEFYQRNNHCPRCNGPLLLTFSRPDEINILEIAGCESCLVHFAPHIHTVN